MCAAIKEIGDARVGDTMTLAKKAAAEPLAGYSEPNPMVPGSLHSQLRSQLRTF